MIEQTAKEMVKETRNVPEECLFEQAGKQNRSKRLRGRRSPDSTVVKPYNSAESVSLRTTEQDANNATLSPIVSLAILQGKRVRNAGIRSNSAEVCVWLRLVFKCRRE